MSFQITNAFKQQFRDNFIIRVQQMDSRLRAAVMDEPDFLQGKAGFFDRIGKTSMVKRTGRHTDTPQIDTQHSRRKVTLDDFEWADLVDMVDMIRTIADPTSKYIENATMAARRQFDDEIILAMFGVSVATDEDDGDTNIPLPASQKVAVGATGLTIAKLITAREILDANEVPDGDRFLAAGAKDMSDLLGTTEITSSDFNSVKALVRGDIDSFMGFTFIKSQRLGLDTNNDRRVAVWQKQSIGLAIGEDIITRISERADKSFSVQPFVRMSVGAVRIEEESFVEIAVQP